MHGADDRYPERLNGVKLILFPKPKTNREKMSQMDKCLRKTSQATQYRPNKQTQRRLLKGVFKLKCCAHVLILVVFISLQNFVGGNGSKPTLARKPPTKRKRQTVLTD